MTAGYDPFGPPRPWHRWRANEDPDYQPGAGMGPDYCRACGVVRYPLTRWGQSVAEGPCPGPPARVLADLEEMAAAYHENLMGRDRPLAERARALRDQS